MVQPPSFCMNINQAWAEKRMTAGLRPFVDEFLELRSSLEAIHFIYGNGSHWWLCSLSFTSKEFQIRDGLTMSPPAFRTQFEYVFQRFLSVNLKSWKIVRLPCPHQHDSHSCGIVALSTME